MNSTIEEKERTHKFPCLMIHESGDCMLLVSGTCDTGLIGTVVFSNDSELRIGDFRKSWKGVNFTAFDGTVTLNTG